MALRQQLGNTLPDTTSASLQGESEHSVGSPAGILLIVDDVGDGAVHIYCGHTLTQPLTLHLLWWYSPHLHTKKSCLQCQNISLDS